MIKLILLYLPKAQSENCGYRVLLFPAWIFAVTFRAILEILLWPLISLLETLIIKLKNMNCESKTKTECIEEVNMKVEQSTRAHLLEVCLESSFQVLKHTKKIF